MTLNCLSPIWKERWFRSLPLNCNLCGCAEIRWIHPGYPRWVQIMFQKSGGNKTPTWLAAVKLVAKPFPAVWTWAVFLKCHASLHALFFNLAFLGWIPIRQDVNFRDALPAVRWWAGILLKIYYPCGLRNTLPWDYWDYSDWDGPVWLWKNGRWN